MSSISPQLRPQFLASSEEENINSGPEIPSDLLEQRTTEEVAVPALLPDLTASRSGPERQQIERMLGPAFLPQHSSYSGDDGNNVGPMPLPAGYQKPVEVDGVKPLPEQKGKVSRSLLNMTGDVKTTNFIGITGQSPPGKVNQGLSIFSVYIQHIHLTVVDYIDSQRIIQVYEKLEQRAKET
ncbi:hypothetical protein L218DRAFT_1062870 [Marasmius fiardii PR-910]|nr:hypothetical protein L218DRAFT_1062870 [Marasmius fiardii PR-910]